MKKYLLCLLGLCLTVTATLPAQSYRYTVDLRTVTDDRLTVELVPPPMPLDTLVFQLPSIVPGTYSIYDFGRFADSVQAFDAQGRTIPVQQRDVNSWAIAPTAPVARIRYQVRDTWDDDSENSVFEPGGSNIEAGTNFFLNHHCVFGFFENHREIPFEIEYRKPAGFYGATTLPRVHSDSLADHFRAQNYFELADNPVMYSLPDTALIQVGGASVLVAVYSPNQKVTSGFVAQEIRPVLEAQKAYLGGKLPITNYAFIIYLFDGFSMSGSYGALEHNTCSMYYLPEYESEYITQTIRDFSAHEFFHIVTPLSIHSEEIHYFDFMKPTMSQHLWLYEGVTEYSAGHVQVKHGLITLSDYLDMMREKILDAQTYNDTLPFTKMSRGVLDEYEEQYGNVYQKGALIGMCLDLLLRKESGGKYGIQNLMQDLSREYGRTRPFRDDELFTRIEQLTYPAVGAFLRRHVGGDAPLPLTEMLEWAGIYYAIEAEQESYSLGGIGIDVNEEGFIVVDDVSEMDEFGMRLGYARGDVLYKFQGQELSLYNAIDVFDAFFESHQEGDIFEIVVRRPKNKKAKKFKEITLSAPIVKVTRVVYDELKEMKDASPAQLELRKAWLGDYRTE